MIKLNLLMKEAEELAIYFFCFKKINKNVNVKIK